MIRLTVFSGLLFAFLSSAGVQDKKAGKEAAPKLLYTVPLVAKVGVRQKIALRGKGLAAGTKVKVTGAEGVNLKVLSSKAVGVPNNYPVERVGDSEVEIELELPKDAKPGAVKLVAVGAGGESNVYSLCLRDALPFIVEKEPNDGFESAQLIMIPCAVEGTIKGERDVDVYKFEGKKGDKLRIEVQAARLGSPVDAFVTVHDAARRILDSADDTNGLPDPILAVTVPKDGPYFIAVIDANDLGGAQFGYRLLVRKE